MDVIWISVELIFKNNVAYSFVPVNKRKTIKMKIHLAISTDQNITKTWGDIFFLQQNLKNNVFCH